jgi:hypothetical protein
MSLDDGMIPIHRTVSCPLRAFSFSHVVSMMKPFMPSAWDGAALQAIRDQRPARVVA